MSNKQVTDSRIPGWADPVFPQSVVELHKAYARFFGHVDGGELRSMACKVRHFVQEWPKEEVASDGYVGFRTFTFAVNGGLLALRFPFFQDQEMQDGTTTDRSVAAYGLSSGKPLAPEALDTVADSLRKQMKMHPLFTSVRAPTFVPQPII